VRAILTIPPYLMGFSPEVLFATNVVIGFQGLVSHFNVNSRVAWLNYLLVGTELWSCPCTPGHGLCAM
jgi:sterol desaturase/sphingolipid hydroxylase (fatty acid hydroxylase superfamily)